jgi:hypothetical protein
MALDADCWTWLPEELVREIVVRYCPIAWVDGLTPELTRPLFSEEDWEFVKEEVFNRLKRVQHPPYTFDRSMVSVTPAHYGNYAVVSYHYSPNIFSMMLQIYYGRFDNNIDQTPHWKFIRPWVNRNPRLELAKRFASIKF